MELYIFFGVSSWVMRLYGAGGRVYKGYRIFLFLCASSVILKKKKNHDVIVRMSFTEVKGTDGGCRSPLSQADSSLLFDNLRSYSGSVGSCPFTFTPSLDPLPTWRGRSQTWCNYTHLAAEKSQDWQVVCGLLCLSPDKGHDPPLTATVLLDQGSPTILVRGPDTRGSRHSNTMK